MAITIPQVSINLFGNLADKLVEGEQFTDAYFPVEFSNGTTRQFKIAMRDKFNVYVTHLHKGEQLRDFFLCRNNSQTHREARQAFTQVHVQKQNAKNAIDNQKVLVRRQQSLELAAQQQEERLKELRRISADVTPIVNKPHRINKHNVLQYSKSI